MYMCVYKKRRYPNSNAMEEGTLKTQIPYCRLYWSFLLGVVKQFCRFRIWSETECKTPAKYGPQYIQRPTNQQAHIVCIYEVSLVYTDTVHWEGGEGGGGQREVTVEGQQYTSIVPSSMGATVHKLGRKYKL
jgi:hypothetical protein